jgi:hypothetical protein
MSAADGRADTETKERIEAHRNRIFIRCDGYNL